MVFYHDFAEDLRRLARISTFNGLGMRCSALFRC